MIQVFKYFLLLNYFVCKTLFLDVSPKGQLSVNINGVTVNRTESYKGYYQDTDTNILLMNAHNLASPSHGAVTDVNTWSRHRNIFK